MANGSGYGCEEWPKHVLTSSKRKVEVEVGKIIHRISFTGYETKYQCMICRAKNWDRPQDIKHKKHCPVGKAHSGPTTVTDEEAGRAVTIAKMPEEEAKRAMVRRRPAEAGGEG